MPIIAGPTEIPSSVAPPVSQFDSGPFPNGTPSAGLIAGLFFSTSSAQELANSGTITGTSWTQNYPAIPNAFSLYNWYDPGSNTIYVANALTAVDILLINVATAAVTTIVGPTVSNLFVNTGLVALLPNGSIALVLLEKPSATVTANFYRYTGGIWSGPVVLTDNGGASVTNIKLLDIAVDSNNVSYILYNLESGGASLVKVQTVDSSGNLGPVCTVLNSASSSTFQTNYGRRLMLFNSQLWVAVVDPITKNMSVYRSGSLTNIVFPANTPVTFTQSYTTAPGANVTFGGPNLVGSSTMYVVWSAQTIVSSVVTKDQMIVSAYSGSGDTWGANQIGLDWVNNPPPAPPFLTYPAGQASHFWSTHQMADGTFGTFCDFNTASNCFVFYTDWTAGLVVVCGP